MTVPKTIDREALVDWLNNRAAFFAARSKAIVDGGGDLSAAHEEWVRASELLAVARNFAGGFTP